MWYIHEGKTPLVAAAIHTGHEIRHEVAENLALSDSDRLREEDPFTGSLTTVAQNRLTVFRSRFEVDVNRPREKALYRGPEDAWGLHLWKHQPPKELIERSLEEYDRFYAEGKRFLTDLERRSGQLVIGAPEEGVLEQTLFGSIPQRAAEKASITVVMVKQHHPVKYGLKRWFNRGVK